MIRFYLEIQKHFGKDSKNQLDSFSLLTYLHLKKNCLNDQIKELYSVYPPPLDYLHYSFLKYLFYAVFSRFCFGKMRKRMRSKRKLLKQIIKINKIQAEEEKKK